jgi:GNAT superfamily N-acetyltransferase
LLVDADTGHDFLNVAALRAAPGPAREAVDQACGWFAVRRVGFRFLLAEPEHPEVAAHLIDRGWQLEHRLPAMLLHPLPDRGPTPAALQIEVVEAGAGVADYGGIGGDEQGLDRELMRAFAEVAVSGSEFVPLLGRVDGVPVATSLALITGSMVGVYNVNVVEPLRRRGLGSAMTWAAIEAGRARGGEAAFLEATRASYPLYRRLGFRTRFHYLQLAPP